MATSTLLLYLAFTLCEHFSRAGRYFEQNNDDTCICKLNCPIEEVLQEVEQLEERVKNLDRSQTEQRLSLEKKLDSLQKRPEETHTSATSQTNAVNQNNAVVRVEEQMAALHRNITTGQQQMTEMQQQMMAELQTQRRMMSALETKVSAINSTVVSQETKVSAINTAVVTLATKVSAINTAVVTLDTKVSAINSTVVALESRQQQMTEMQQQMMAELQTQRRMMSALETRFIPKDCADLQREELSAQSGVHTVFVGPNLLPVRVFCDLENEGGGWLVFQRRKDGSQDFQQNWDVYARGFGDLLGEFWLGNDFLHLLTAQKTYTLRVDMEDFESGTRYAEYSTFTVGPASDKFRLRLGNYSGDAGDSMTYHSGEQFSTIDQDNDHNWRSCSSVRGGGGWWYGNCRLANLNGLYLRGEHTADTGVVWHHWRGSYYSLKTTVMKIRPANY